MAQENLSVSGDGLCIISFAVKKDITEPPSLGSSLFSFPVDIQCQLLTLAWHQSSSLAEQQSLRCSCRLARAFADHLIDSADLMVDSPTFEEGACRQLARFPKQAKLTRLILRQVGNLCAV